MTRRTYEAAERRMWRDAFCAILSCPGSPVEGCAQVADLALEEWRKRYPPPKEEPDPETALAEWRESLPDKPLVICAACGRQLTKPTDYTTWHNVRVQWSGLTLCVTFALCKDPHAGNSSKLVPAAFAVDPYRPVAGTITMWPDHQPPISTDAAPHPFTPVSGNPYCGSCGGGKLHPIHQGGTHAR